MSIVTDRIATSTGVVASGGPTVVEPAYIYGQYLTNNGLLFLSFAEIIQINAALYITFKLVTGVYSFVKGKFNG